MPNPFNRLRPFFASLLSTLEPVFLQLSRPTRYSLALSTAADLPRSKTQLIAENALLRQQLIILHRQINKPQFTQLDRLWLVLLASCVHHWKDTVLTKNPIRVVVCTKSRPEYNPLVDFDWSSGDLSTCPTFPAV